MILHTVRQLFELSINILLGTFQSVKAFDREITKFAKVHKLCSLADLRFYLIAAKLIIKWTRTQNRNCRTWKGLSIDIKKIKISQHSLVRNMEESGRS